MKLSMKYFLLMSLFTGNALASDMVLSLKNKQEFVLTKSRTNQYIENSSLRVSKPQLQVSMKLDKDEDLKTYDVNIDGRELYSRNQKLGIKLAGNRAKLNFGNARTGMVVKDMNLQVEKKNLHHLFDKSIEKDLKKIAADIDKNLGRKVMKMSIKSSDFSCTQLTKEKAKCILSSEIEGKVRDNRLSPANELKKHLLEIKQEMLTNPTSNYDIDGYREFLNKSVDLVKSENITKSLKDVRRLIINERIDSYEYTAIRSTSILKFVEVLLLKLS